MLCEWEPGHENDKLFLSHNRETFIDLTRLVSRQKYSGRTKAAMVLLKYDKQTHGFLWQRILRIYTVLVSRIEHTFSFRGNNKHLYETSLFIIVTSICTP